MKEKIICSICGKEIEESDLMLGEKVDMINGAVIGEYIEVHGHSNCIHNVDASIVVPNRARIINFIEKLKKETEETEMEDTLLRLIDEELLPQA